MDYLIIKTTNELIDADSQSEVFKKFLSGQWKLNPKRLDKVESVVIVKDNVVINEFKLGAKIFYDREIKRCSVDLIDLQTPSKLIGSRISYGTANPATIKSEKDFRNLIVK